VSQPRLTDARQRLLQPQPVARTEGDGAKRTRVSVSFSQVFAVEDHTFRKITALSASTGTGGGGSGESRTLYNSNS